MDKINEVTENSIMVLTPFGSPMGWVNYFMSLMQLREECRDNDIKLNYFFEKNASLITHARNDMVNNFLLNTTAEFMIFIDSDVEFDPSYIVKWVKEKKDFAKLPSTKHVKTFPSNINNKTAAATADTEKETDEKQYLGRKEPLQTPAAASPLLKGPALMLIPSPAASP